MSAPSQEYRLPNGGPSIAALPKVSLHDHLDGGLRPTTIVELASAAGIALPVDDAAGLASWFASDRGSLVEYLQTFAVTSAVMQTAPALRRIAHEFVLDLAADGVIHGEVRWAPSKHLQGGLTLDEAVEAVQAGLDDGIEDLAERGHRIGIGQILCALRNDDPAAAGPDHGSLAIAELALRHRDSGVVGFDIAGPEAGFAPSAHAAAFDLLQREFLPVTVHAGEADGLASIRGALIDGHALRLGHGVRIADDISVLDRDTDHTTVGLGPIATWVRDRRIALELAPTSNLQTGAIAAWGDEMYDHPFDLLYQLGFRVTVNPDNRLMSSTSISRELALLAQAFDYDLDDLERFQLNAAESAFLPLEERDDLAERIVAGFEEA